ncbi:MAG: SHOCT domain-containing protein [Nostocoides sp.]
MDMNSFWSWIWLLLMSFAFVAYIFAIFAIVTDLFRDHKMSGWGKALWIIFLVILPLLTALVYLIARGGGMEERSAKAASQSQAAADAYIRQVASNTSPADQIAQAKTLLENGTISQAEFDQLKVKALT